jgi:predicted RNA-binding protein YlxR (DUF448 family)
VGPARAPERTCVGCRTRAPKASLLRVVRPPGSETAQADPAGTAPGRGAYVHRSAECLDRALSRGALGRALAAGMGEVEVGRLRSAIADEDRGGT